MGRKMRRMKTGVAMLTAMVLLVSALPAAAFGYAQQNEMEPSEVLPMRYQYIDLLTAELSISSSGLATCKAEVQTKNPAHTVELSMQLQKYSNESRKWEPYYTWPTLTGNGLQGVTTTKTHYVTRGKYRVAATGTVYNANGGFLEDDTAYSQEIIY